MTMVKKALMAAVALVLMVLVLVDGRVHHRSETECKNDLLAAGPLESSVILECCKFLSVPCLCQIRTELAEKQKMARIGEIEREWFPFTRACTIAASEQVCSLDGFLV
ncbi:uncharacterized protein LOC123439089 [Hordeum vulgare subsp. vulgare]|uniref:uncharacterized protein LOC123439089 n=1 Tax=Hordeum vulgare subsp. vulgare TaxID=112509 RepID=UPI00162EFF95|nr:uncharacterized protein LOC123439089 [Hordeum vulgare subsp. vulgare]